MEGEAVAGFAGGDDFAVVDVHGFANEKQFEANFLAITPTEMKGIKDFFQGVFIQARAVVAHGQANVFPRFQQAKFFRNGNGFERYGYFAGALGQAVPGLEAKLNEGLLDLGGVGQHGRAFGGDMSMKLDLAGDDGAEDGQGFGDDVLELGRFVIGQSALGEFAEFDDEIAGAMRGFENMVEGFAGGMDFWEFEGNHFSGAENAGDEIVKFVGGAGRELIERGKFQLVELLQVCGRGFFFGVSHGAFRGKVAAGGPVCPFRLKKI